MKTRIPFFSIAAGMIAIAGLVFWANREKGSAAGGDRILTEQNSIRNGAMAQTNRVAGGAKPLSDTGKTGLDDGSVADGRETEAPVAADEDELVEKFDRITDKWIKASGKEISIRDVEDFLAGLKKVPARRRKECVQRALNLVPDENILIVAGALMDKSLGKEIVTTVFEDVLNRDEKVKKLLLQQVFKDKTHPCWTDAAWILDVTGQLPDRK